MACSSAVEGSLAQVLRSARVVFPPSSSQAFTRHHQACRGSSAWACKSSLCRGGPSSGHPPAWEEGHGAQSVWVALRQVPASSERGLDAPRQAHRSRSHSCRRRGSGAGQAGVPVKVPRAVAPAQPPQLAHKVGSLQRATASARLAGRPTPGCSAVERHVSLRLPCACHAGTHPLHIPGLLLQQVALDVVSHLQHGSRQGLRARPAEGQQHELTTPRQVQGGPGHACASLFCTATSCRARSFWKLSFSRDRLSSMAYSASPLSSWWNCTHAVAGQPRVRTAPRLQGRTPLAQACTA